MEPIHTLRKLDGKLVVNEFLRGDSKNIPVTEYLARGGDLTALLERYLT